MFTVHIATSPDPPVGVTEPAGGSVSYSSHMRLAWALHERYSHVRQREKACKGAPGRVRCARPRAWVV